MKLSTVLLILLHYVLTIKDITSFGAIVRQDIVSVQFVNAKAIENTILAANSSQIDRVVRIPKGTFYTMPIELANLYNLSIVIEGKLSASKNITAWPKQKGTQTRLDMISITNSSYVEISGGGKVDGRGYNWWMIEWMQSKKIWPKSSKRPHMFGISDSNNFKIHDLILKNSPSFHLRLPSCSNFDLYNLDIKVNTTAQFNLAKRFSVQGLLPTFPLNTDGIDPSGTNFHIWNITVQNFDDVVVPKPSHQGGTYPCTQNILVQNITVKLGVGLSIGSVPPNINHNCIRNVVFRNAIFDKPLKGIYLKTNPGDEGSGEIVNITYENMKMYMPIWWAIYLGPQQQKQPDGGGPGCMLYPFDPKGTCTTQPLINVRNITLSNIEVHNSWLFPILIRCNETNPCTGIKFKDVRATNWKIGNKNKGYVCENAQGVQEGSYPQIDCLTDSISSLRKENEIINYSEFQIAQAWRKIEKAVEQIPYIEEDDEMDEIDEWMRWQIE